MKTQHKNAFQDQNSKGFILVTTYLVVAVVSVFSMAYLLRSTAFLQASERNRNKIIAFNMAEAAADFALAQLATDAAYTGTATFNSLDAGSSKGGFTVAITTPEGNSNIRMIQASGFAPSTTATSRAYQASTITTYGEFQSSSLFSFGVFAKGAMSFSGNAEVDSYDSRNGAYGGGNVASNGDIATNSVAADAVSVGTNAQVKGDATVGPGGNPATVIDLARLTGITGTQTAATEERLCPVQTTSSINLGALNLAGNTTRTLPAGTYHYSSISITGNARLVFTGSVNLYVDGEVKIAGNGVGTQGNLPTNLMIFVLGTTEVKLAGNGTFYGGIYAPLAPVKNTGNGELFGAVVCDNYTQSGNGDVHFDEAMKEIQGSGGSGAMTVKAWQEQNSLTWGTGT